MKGWSFLKDMDQPDVYDTIRKFADHGVDSCL